LEGKWLLDAGCGAGRFAEIAAPRGPNLVALDYSSAVDAAAHTLARFPNVDVIQGNLLKLPFKPSSFHFAYCIGVVQHTPDPPAVIANVVNTLAPGGQFAFTIYGRRPWTKLSGKYLIRPLTRRLPQRQLLRMIQLSMPALYPIISVAFRLPIVGKFFSFAIPIAYYPDRDGFSAKQRYQETVLDTFDALSPRYDFPMTPCEVESALRGSNASTWTFRTRFPINAVGSV
jgi:SAM-dependent methyltransferase